MRHRVQKWGHPTVTVPQPKDEWQGATFHAANGEQFEVVKMPSYDWPQGLDARRDVPARLHLKSRRAAI